MKYSIYLLILVGVIGCAPYKKAVIGITFQDGRIAMEEVYGRGKSFRFRNGCVYFFGDKQPTYCGVEKCWQIYSVTYGKNSPAVVGKDVKINY